MVAIFTLLEAAIPLELHNFYKARFKTARLGRDPARRPGPRPAGQGSSRRSGSETAASRQRIPFLRASIRCINPEDAEYAYHLRSQFKHRPATYKAIKPQEK